MGVKEDIIAAIVGGDSAAAERSVVQALEAGLPAEELLREALIPGMSEVGRRFECGDYYVAEMLVSAHAMKAGLHHLRPLLAAAAVEPVGVVVIGTVKGDLHDIGKNLVGMMLEGAGFQVIDLGVDVSAERFVQAAKDHNADLVALSALLTTTMPTMQRVVEAVKAAGLSAHAKVIIGGAPVTEAFAHQIGADGFAADAANAGAVARRLLDLPSQAAA
jgi:5-methyltetrahydrofolate--homocysteine methyltransferase